MIFLVAKELKKPLSMVCVQSDGENEKEKKNTRHKKNFVRNKNIITVAIQLITTFN